MPPGSVGILPDPQRAPPVNRVPVAEEEFLKMGLQNELGDCPGNWQCVLAPIVAANLVLVSP